MELDPGTPPTSSAAPDALAKIGDVAAAAGIQRVHLVAWRDIDDVEAGGSEVHATRIASLWAAAGLDVVLRTSFAQGHPPEVVRDGYRVVRRAGRYLVFPRAASGEVARRNGRPDALVEIWNGMPFFSPLWSRRPKVVFIHHVHAEMWRMVLPPNLARIGETVERRLAPPLYRRTRIITLSESSKAELVAMLGFAPDRVSVVPPGIDERFRPGGERAARPLAIAVGRLVPVKRYDRLIRAAVAVRARVAGFELHIVGEGYEREALERLIGDLDAGEFVHLRGRVDDGELVRLYQRAWVLASASAREGWGMSITEAAACATPAVASRIAGHADSVHDGETGLLVDDEAGPDGLAAAMIAVLGDPVLRRRLSAAALAATARLTWTATATEVMRALAAEAGRRRR